MYNKEYKIGSHISIHGYNGIVEKIINCKEYEVSYKNNLIDKQMILSDENVKAMLQKEYALKSTGRTATYFIVSFNNEESLKNTAYNGGCYGCLDEYEEYGTW